MRIALHRVAHHQHRAVLRVVVRVKVSLVPGGEFLHVLQCGVIRLHYLGGKLRALVALEPPADKLIEARLVGEAPARAMHRHEAAAVLDIVLQVGPLVRLDPAVVGVEQQGVEFGQARGIAKGFLNGCHVVKIDCIAAKGAGEHRVKLVGVVMLAFVAKEEHSDWPIGGLGQVGRAWRSPSDAEAQQCN